jgi:hypothetical protein
MRSILVSLWFCAGCGVQAQAETPPAPPPVEPVVAEPVAPPAEDDAVANVEEAPAAPAADRTFRVASRDLTVFTKPRKGGVIRGVIHKGHPFEVLGPADGSDCTGGWAELPSNGFACLDHTEVTTDAPKAQPELVSYDAPTPEEFWSYMETGEYSHDQPEALVPSVYAKRWRRFQGKLYANLDAWNAGKPPVGALLGGAGNKYHFTHIVETERGPVLVREDGQVAALNDVYVYPLSRLEGRDLRKDPVPEGMMAAWAVDYDETAVYPRPDLTAEIHHRIAYHTPLLVKKDPVGDGTWYVLPDALGPGVDGYVEDTIGIKHPVQAPTVPAGVGPDELWIDVELNQQVIQLFKGSELVWYTLVSTGEAPMGTPRGIYEITDKMATKTMRSRPDAEDQYMVEDVPWTIHFKPAYAIHGAYWHWGFGHTASHGCINMAPKDVKYLWEQIDPHIPDGWHTSWTTDVSRGTVLQVRRGDAPVTDFRSRVAKAE